jgi:ABC-2 type transport system ATP-binding protein
MIKSNLEQKPILIEFRGVSKSFKDVQALNQISFSVRRGEILGYIGPNGAGKTTSMKILVGLIQDYSGQVLFEGQIMHQSALRTQIGYLPQETGFQEWRTVYQALWTFGRLSGMNSSLLQNRIPQILNLVDLPDVQDRKIVNLSGGMQQKLKLAQALLHNPSLIILDEPLNGLDPASRHQAKMIIKNFAEQGKTVIFSSHVLSDVQDIADNIAIINRGQLIKLDSPEALQTQFQIGNDLELVFTPDSPICTGFDSIPGVERTEWPNPHRLLIHLLVNADIDAVIHNVLGKVQIQNIRPRNFNLLKPSLEEVYLKLIGGYQQ